MATRIVYVANPIPRAPFLAVAKSAAFTQPCLLVIDAAYQEYVDQPEAEDPRHLVEKADNCHVPELLEVFGLAGARVGWAYGPPRWSMCSAVSRSPFQCRPSQSPPRALR
jgi:histidinol-phosphate aminotransferase